MTPHKHAALIKAWADAKRREKRERQAVIDKLSPAERQLLGVG